MNKAVNEGGEELARPRGGSVSAVYTRQDQKTS